MLTEQLQQRFGIEIWLASVLAIVLATALVDQGLRMLLRRLERWTHASSSPWDEALLLAGRRPLRAVVWLAGLTGVARAVQAHWPQPDWLGTALLWRNIGVLVCLAWFLWQLIDRLTQASIRRRTEAGAEFDLTTAMALSKLLRLIVVVVTAVTAAHSLGFQIGGVLALGGVGGIAVGLAAKDLLANFFGGLTIYLDRPFSVGDWIRSPDKSIEGTVEYISWRHTRIRAFNKNPIYVPNAVFTTIVVENPSRMTHRRIKEVIGLRYDDFAQVEAVIDDIRQWLNAHPAIDKTQDLIVTFDSYGDSSLNIMVYAFTPTRAWGAFLALKQELLLSIGRIVERHGAQMPFPTQTLQLSGDAPSGPPTDPTRAR
ncbi:mechanosensitive ion channel family protein [Hydrogenophaga sp.]|uniref:mechanosensitive ion channel family protein n=1 Tax=Hydrogenophaga sp. TaxID=1904254 RepID=UPI00286E797F|nr:mechanosensitive ion channel family protein [Hydrogenophaga sp.]